MLQWPAVLAPSSQKQCHHSSDSMARSTVREADVVRKDTLHSRAHYYQHIERNLRTHKGDEEMITTLSSTCRSDRPHVGKGTRRQVVGSTRKRFKIAPIWRSGMYLALQRKQSPVSDSCPCGCHLARRGAYRRVACTEGCNSTHAIAQSRPDDATHAVVNTHAHFEEHEGCEGGIQGRCNNWHSHGYSCQGKHCHANRFWGGLVSAQLLHVAQHTPATPHLASGDSDSNSRTAPSERDGCHQTRIHESRGNLQRQQCGVREA